MSSCVRTRSYAAPRSFVCGVLSLFPGKCDLVAGALLAARFLAYSRVRMPERIDFEVLFDIAPNPYMVLDHELRYVAANAAYLEVTASKLEDLVGQHVFDRFPNDPADPNNVPAQMLRRSLERVLATGQRDHLALLPYRVPKVGEEVEEQMRYWSATHTPVLDASGKVRFILQHTVDVTELHARELATTGDGGDLRQEAGVFSRARAVQEENARIDAEREHLRVLFQQAPGFMCFLEGEGHVFRLANAAYLTLINKRDIIGKRLREVLPEVVGQGFEALLDRVCSTREPFIGEGAQVFLHRREGEPPDEVFVDFIYQPVVGEDGKARGIFVQGHDVTMRKRAERESEEARRAAEAFSEELQRQSAEVLVALEAAKKRIAELEAQLGAT